ncbi:hypothetical protein C370_03928 [Cryptococcus neoformans A1-35-8]|nr:hypothetical protein C369_03857 [Cryptococcus neoformans var. grubii A5-35-17]OXH10333.1 hypothetical protein C370_03928 [Cryptococcus neoformans var. grubii A1-35-8]
MSPSVKSQVNLTA